MAEGIRIRHKTLKSVMLVIRDQARPIPNPRNVKLDPCRTCGVPHDVKTYHFQLDSEGCIIVSEGILEKLKGLADHGGFDVVNRVKKPPTQVLKIPTVVQKTRAFDPIRREHIHAD